MSLENHHCSGKTSTKWNDENIEKGSPENQWI